MKKELLKYMLLIVCLLNSITASAVDSTRCKNFHYSKALRIEYMFIDGKENGQGKTYHPNGKFKLMVERDCGGLNTTEKYDSNDNKI